jgi:hypothetical protein
MSDRKNVTQLRPAIGADKQPHSPEELERQGSQTNSDQPHLRAQEEMQRRVKAEQPEDESEIVATEPGGMYETPASDDDITPNNETMSKSPGNKPSQAEGGRRTVEQDLGQKNSNG